MRFPKWPKCQRDGCGHSRIRHSPGDGTCRVGSCACTSFDDSPPRPRPLIEVLADED